MFITENKIEKNAGYKLQNEVATWNQDILKRLFEENDWLNPDTYYIRWKNNFDGENGFGTGVVVLEKEGKIISLPIIVKNYELQPLDIFYDVDRKDLFPFTEKTVEQAFFNTGIAEKLVKQKGTGETLVQDLFPPRYGKYTFASAQPEVLSKIDITEEDIADFHARIKEASVLTDAYENKNEIFVKVAKIIIRKNPVELGRVFEEQEKIASVVVSPEKTKGYRMDWLESDEVKTKIASYIDTYQLLKENFNIEKSDIDRDLNLVDNGGIVSFTNMNKVASVLKTDKKQFAPVTTTSKISTKTVDGKTIEGYVLPRVYSLQTGKISREKVLIDSNRNIVAVSNDIIGLKKSGNINEVLKKFKFKVPTRNTVISFAWFDQTLGDYACLQPAKIMNYEQIENVGLLYTLMTNLGTVQPVIVMNKVKAPDFSKKNEYGAIILPENSIYLTMDSKNQTRLVKNSDEHFNATVKTASVINGTYFKETGEIYLKEAGQTKIASCPHNALVELATRGIPCYKAEAFIKEAMFKGSSKMYVFYPEMEKEASADEKEALLEKTVADLREIRSKYDLVKIAAGLKEMETLDKVLALNFINKRNLAIFFKMLPHFKETTMKLSQLLLGARVGSVGVDEKIVSDALVAMQTLVEKMEGFQVDKA